MIQKILEDVYNQEIAESKETAHKALAWRSSSLGSCLRGQFLGRLFSGDFKVQHDRRTMDVFEIGNIVEDIKIAKLKKHPDYLVITQGEMYESQINLTGHFDALIIHLPTGEPFMFECKSKNSRAFTYMDKKKEGAMAHHKQQIHSYMFMCNSSGFCLPDEQAFSGEVYKWLCKNADVIGTRNCTTPRFSEVVKNVWRLRKNIKEGFILYVSKDDQRLLEYPVQFADSDLAKQWSTELGQLNKAWINQDVLPETDKTHWNYKYCQYCQAGLCEKLNSKEVVVDLFKVVEEADKQRELEAKQKAKEKLKLEEYPF